MKFIALACLVWLALLTFSVAGESPKHEFPIVIEGVKCRVTPYKPTTPIILDPLVAKDFRPKSQLILAILLTKSDISSHLSDEELIKFSGGKFDKEALEQHRSRMKEMYALTGPAAADNPWKGMKYAVEQTFLVESERGKFLVYQLSTHGAKDISGKLSGSIKNIDGTWIIGGEKSEEGQKFQGAMVQLVPQEFDKLNQTSSIESLPLDDLFK